MLLYEEHLKARHIEGERGNRGVRLSHRVWAEMDGDERTAESQ